jgi:hypothetical protein
MPNKPPTVSSDPDSKVLFRVPCNDGTDEAHVETLWAWSLENDNYKLDNLPYFAYSVSCGDIVYAPFDPDEGFPTYQKVVERSGNKTIRLFFEEAYEDGNSTFNSIQDIVAMGCEFEGSSRKYFCINIPPKADFNTVADYLIKNEVQFEFADPTYEELYPEIEDNN